MEIVFKFLIKIFPDDWVLILNEQSLEEMDRRDLLIWADDLQPQNQN